MARGANILFKSEGSALGADFADGASGAGIPPLSPRCWSLVLFAAAAMRAACLGRTPLSLSGRGNPFQIIHNSHVTFTSKDLQHDPVA